MRIQSLAPPRFNATKNNLADHQDTLMHIRSYAISLEQLQLYPISNPPPDWYDHLNGNINNAKTHAQNWTNSIEPQIVSNIPQLVSNVQVRFNVVANNWKTMLDPNGTGQARQPTRDEIESIMHDLGWLQHHMNRDRESFSRVQTGFTHFKNNSDADFQSLSHGVDSIQHAIEVDEQDIARIRNLIDQEKVEIKADNLKIEASAIASGVGLFLGAGLIGFGAAAGPAAPVLLLVGGFCCIASIAQAAGVIAHFESQIRHLRDEINTQTAQLSHETQQALLLTALQKHIYDVVEKNQMMANSLSSVMDWFEDVIAKSNTALQELADARDDTGTDQNSPDWQDFLDDLEVALDTWHALNQFVNNMQNQATGSHVHTHRV